MNNIMTMSVNGYIMLNVFSSLVLLIIFSKKTIRSAALEHILFEGMIATTIILLITDTIIWILSGETGTGLRIVNIFSTAVYYICHPLLLSLWTLYADYSLFRSRKRITRLGAIVFSVNLIFYFFIIASIWNGYIFIINKDNIYSRGSQFIIFFAACYSFIVYTFFVILLNRKKSDSSIIKTLLFFCIPPTAAGVIQAYFYGITIIWPAMMISILLIYINIQNSLITTDYLTGIFNRRQFDSILSRRIISGRNFSLIMIDIDNFKSINDLFGHNEGDAALEISVKIIQSALRTGDIIARYAGDEFLVLLDLGDRSGLAAAVSRIRKRTLEWNRTGEKAYSISFSMGSEIFHGDGNLTLEEIVNSVDVLMFEDKKKKHIKER